MWECLHTYSFEYTLYNVNNEHWCKYKYLIVPWIYILGWSKSLLRFPIVSYGKMQIKLFGQSNIFIVGKMQQLSYIYLPFKMCTAWLYFLLSSSLVFFQHCRALYKWRTLSLHYIYIRLNNIELPIFDCLTYKNGNFIWPA